MDSEDIPLTIPKNSTDKEFVEFFVSVLASSKLLSENRYFMLYGRDIRRLGSLSQYESMYRFLPDKAYIFSFDYLLTHVSHAQARL